MADPHLILFDIDGTLLHPHGSGRESTRHAMLEIFGTVGALDTHQFGGKTDWQTLVELLTAHGYNADRIGSLMPRYMHAIARHLDRMIDDFPVAACPGAPELVADLRERGTPLGIVTGNVESTAPIKLRAAGYDPAWFPIGAYGSDALDRNDLPRLALRRAITHYRAEMAPERVIVVGDTPMDIACARALGAVAVAVTTGSASREALAAAQPDYLLDDLTTFTDTGLL